jgi:hypothetical protein
VSVRSSPGPDPRRRVVKARQVRSAAQAERLGLRAAQRRVGLARANAYLAQRHLRAAEHALVEAERRAGRSAQRSRRR